MNVHNIVELATQFHQGYYRSRRIQDFLRNDLKNFELPPLTESQKTMVKSIWNGIRVDYRWFSYFNRFNEEGREWSPYYVPSNLHYSLIDMFYTDYKKCRTIGDKNLNDLLFYDVKQPQTIVRKASGILFDDRFAILKEKELDRCLTPNKGYIIKPSIDSGGGKHIEVWKPNGSNSIIPFCEKIKQYSSCIVQEFASQHQELASLHGSSLNTIRIMTFFHQGQAWVLSSIVRMGVGGSSIDNASVGGIFCGINSEGRLKNIAYNDYGNVYHTHPTTNETFSNHQIPNFIKLMELAKNLHNRLVEFSKLISWDFAIDGDGNPILIEVNATHGGISFHQMCNGPLFGELTKDVINEVFTRKNRLLSRIF